MNTGKTFSHWYEGVRRQRYLIAILVVSVVLRIIAALIVGDSIEALPGIDDQRSYHMMALRVLDGHGFTVAEDWWPMTRAGDPTAHWSYLYTLYLSAVYGVFGVHPLVARLLQVVLVGIVWPLLAFRIGRRLAGDNVGLMGAAWSALYGYFAYYSVALMTEPFYITAILWAFDLATDQKPAARPALRWVMLGVALGVAVLLRQLFLLFVPFVLLAMWLSRRRAGSQTGGLRFRQAILYPAIALAVIGAMILPWTVRNYMAFGRFVLLNTNAGFAFFWGNHPIYGTDFVGVLPEGAYLELVPPELRKLDEAALDSALMQRGIGFIIDDPGRYILLSLSRAKTYFMFWPSGESGLLSNVVRVLSFGLSLPFMLYGLLAARRQWRAWWLLYAFIMVYSGIHLLSWALVRYRLPVDAVLILFAAYGLVDIIHRLRPMLKRASAPALASHAE